MSLVRVTAENWSRFKLDIEAIESGAEYPLGSDFFRIDHGANYFAFFERLGDLHYFAWLENGKAIAVAAGVLRTMAFEGLQKQAWYLCDLKVHPAYRGNHIPLRLLARAFPWNYIRCPRGYAISMDPSDGSPNRTERLLKRFRWLRFGGSTKLIIWSLDQQEMERVTPTLEKHRGPVLFLSLRGIKDIVLSSTGKPMKLLHAQFGLTAAKGNSPLEKDAVYMLCAPARDPLAIEIRDNFGIKPTATATIISHRMDREDWRWVLTSDI